MLPGTEHERTPSHAADTPVPADPHNDAVIPTTQTHPIPPPARMPYVSGLDGLRAVAVTAVLLYHAEVRGAVGGFLGVEIFFVISGYLITALLLAEWRSNGRIDLGTFWFRRARRLLPALFLLLLVVLTYAVMFLPEEVATLRGDAFAATGYVTNWYLIFNHKSYFESVGRPSLLQHLWSLAVEEQFYLLWPLLLAFGLRWVRRRTFLYAVLGAAALSALLMAVLYHPGTDPSRVYYGTDTRATGFLIGAALAIGRSPHRWGRGIGRTIPPLAFEIAGSTALVGLVAFFVSVGEYDPFLYRGGFVIVALLTAAIIAMLIHPQARFGAVVLGAPPLCWLGMRSYSIYLWHWPVFMLTRPQLDIRLDGVLLVVLRFVITGILAEASYRFVETPVRSGAIGKIWRSLRDGGLPQRRRVLAVEWACVAGVGAVFAFALGAAIIGAKPAPTPAYLSVSSVRTGGAVPTPGSTMLPSTPTSAPVPSSVPLIAADAATAALPTPTAVPTKRVTAIGDSVMIGASDELTKQISNLDLEASIGLQFWSATDILKARKASGQLGEIVIVHVGDNGLFTPAMFDDMMNVLSGTQRVVFVTLKVPRPWETQNNRILADGVKRYPNATLVDWHTASADRPGYFWNDGMHLRPEGAKVYAELIVDRMKNT